jgi:uncharacterized surface protein with fasciclin (FAS1) repeats
MKGKSFFFTGILSGMFVMFLYTTSCSDDVGDNYVTFEDELVLSYLEKDPQNYSEFVAILKASGVADLLSAYGTYTCFAPTNEAVKSYYEKNGTSLEQMTHEEIRDLAFNHLISIELPSIDFPQGVLSQANLSEKFLTITYGTEDGEHAIYVNDKARVILLDQKVHNGIIHTVNSVILSSKIQLSDVIADYPQFSIFADALFATRLSDSLRVIDDKEYIAGKEISNRNGKSYFHPSFRKIGVTALVESDSVFILNGIHNLEELKTYAAKIYDEMYPQDRTVSDLTNRKNSLNRFVAYHLMNRSQGANEFITADLEYQYTPRTTIYQYVEMMSNTLLQIESGNLINKRKNGDAIRFLTVNHEAMNGLFHEIDGILTYDKGMEDDVLNKRIRMDIANMIPEIATNKLRANFNGDVDKYIIPNQYMTGLTCAEGTQFQYFGCKCWHNYEADEFLMCGKYDFTLRIPPIPAGTYEVRMGFATAGQRGVAQVYFDGFPCGIPVNMGITASNHKIGWIRDSDTDDQGIENDKMMRNRGYMKGLTSAYITNQSDIQRNSDFCVRRILETKSFDKTESHTLRIKSVEENIAREFQLDYMEFVPTFFLESEGQD